MEVDDDVDKMSVEADRNDVTTTTTTTTTTAEASRSGMTATDATTNAKSEGSQEENNNNSNSNDSNNSNTNTNDNDNEDDTDSTDDDLDDAMMDAADDDDDDDTGGGVSPEEAERLLTAAVQLKEEGNAHFVNKEKDAKDAAVRCYRRGMNRLKKLKRGPSVEAWDPQVVALYTTLATNLATALCQQKKYTASIAAASQALDVTPMHVKALYRRAVAARAVGDSDKAMRDLQTALTVEPTHVACRKELRQLQQALQKATKQQKKALSKAFSGAVSLYDDKQGPPPPPTPEELEAALQKEKQAWEDECVARMARNEDAISFEDWQAEKKAKQEEQEREAKRKEEERKQREKEERKKRLAEQRAKKKNNNNNNNSNDDSSDEEELTEAELQALRGYKKTKDGRVTSYFTREISDEEKARLASLTGPQKLSTTPQPVTADATATMTATNATAAAAAAATPTSLKKGPSAWNRAGTWEEKDCTQWCHDRLRQRLAAVQTETCQIVKVDTLTGDASVVWTKGQQRYVFDFHATLHYAWTAGPSSSDGANDNNNDDDTKKKRAKGVLKLPDISSTSTHDELEVLFESWKRAPAAQDMARAVADRASLQQALEQAVQAWLQDFRNEYGPHE